MIVQLVEELLVTKEFLLPLFGIDAHNGIELFRRKLKPSPVHILILWHPAE